jgi:hypothetical protein
MTVLAAPTKPMRKRMLRRDVPLVVFIVEVFFYSLLATVLMLVVQRLERENWLVALRITNNLLMAALDSRLQEGESVLDTLAQVQNDAALADLFARTQTDRFQEILITGADGVVQYRYLASNAGQPAISADANVGGQA